MTWAQSRAREFAQKINVRLPESEYQSVRLTIERAMLEAIEMAARAVEDEDYTFYRWGGHEYVDEGASRKTFTKAIRALGVE